MKKNQSPSSFYITYFAKTHNGKEYAEGVKMITRKAQEPNPVGTAGRKFVDRYGVDRYIYWDLEKNDWRHATGFMDIKAIWYKQYTLHYVLQQCF